MASEAVVQNGVNGNNNGSDEEKAAVEKPMGVAADNEAPDENLIPDPDAHLSPEERATIVSPRRSGSSTNQLLTVYETRIENSCGSLIS